jgi:8-oxo-dGTP pyrophosphatase MutT (NUDIX family)
MAFILMWTSLWVLRVIMVHHFLGLKYSHYCTPINEANMGFKRVFYKIAGRLVQQPLARLTRGMTLGARVVVIDNNGHVLLVRHTYSPGWILPGGGVERGETLAAAALREIREEAGIEGEAPIFHGMFSNEPVFQGDHVACYVVRQFSRVAWKSNAEIAEARFFAVNALPEDATGGTRRRLAEILDGAPLSEMW